MTYAKLIDGELVFAPNPIRVGENWMGNPPHSVYETEGYKPAIYTDPPETEPGYVAVPGWEETETEIVQSWEIVEEDISADEAMDILFGGEV